MSRFFKSVLIAILVGSAAVSPALAAPAPAPATPEYWWYYCAQPAGYYPYVQVCPTGWTRVSPVPPGQ